MKIERAELQGALADFAEGGHGLVIGRPGVGKTHSLNALTYTIEERGGRYVFLSVADLGDATEDDLRIALGYIGTFSDTLDGLFASPDVRAALIFDGFDAARNSDTRARVLHIIRSAIRRAPSNWSVVVSVRNYDAAKSPALLELFDSRDATAPAHYTMAGVAARHFAIPELSDAEVKDAAKQIEGFDVLYSEASEELRLLVHIPFNLWLIERIMRTVVDPGPVRALTSEVELLGMYWRSHVTDVEDGDARTAILDRATSEMVMNRRLTFKKAEYLETEDRPSWNSLLSLEVLVESGSGRSQAAFAHNILFDFAVSVLRIGDTPAALGEFLAEDPSRPLFLRPSLVLYFARLWVAQPDDFWKSYFALLAVEALPVRLVGRLIPPFIVASEVRRVEELAPLLRERDRETARGPVAILRVFQALQFSGPRVLLPWIEFAVELIPQLDQTFAWEVAAFLSRFGDKELATAGRSLRLTAGTAARGMFEWAWERRAGPGSKWFDTLAASLLLPVVIKTFDTNAEESASIVDRVLGLRSTEKFSIEFFYSLSEGVEHLIGVAPTLVGDIYRAVFTHGDESEEATRMGSAILPLTSTRRQDFDMCRFILARSYPKFLAAAPETAVAAGIDVLDWEAIEKHVSPYLRENTTVSGLSRSFQFAGAERQYVPDMSVSWRSVRWGDGEDIRNSLEAYLLSDAGMAIARRMTTIVADHATTASCWNLLLEIGSRAPSRYAELLFDLALARPVQMGADTLESLGSFIAAASSHWNSEALALLEENLLALTAHDSADDFAVEIREEKWAIRVRNRLLACIPREKLSTSAARLLIETLEATGALPNNEPLVRMSVSSSAYTNNDWLEERGVDLTTPGNDEALRVRDSVEGFAKRWMNEKAPESESDEFLPVLQHAFARLQAIRGANEADQVVVENAWASLAGAARALARSRLAIDSAPYAPVLAILLEAAAFPPGILPVDIDETFTSPFWSPSPRTEAIQGLIWLASVAPTETIEGVLMTFASSPDPTERFLVLNHASLFREHARGLLLRIVRERVPREQNVVVASALFGALAALVTKADDEPVALVRTHIERWFATEHSDLQRAIADWLVHLAMRRDDAWAREKLVGLAIGWTDHGGLLRQSVFYAINVITPVSASSQRQISTIQRVVAWIQTALSSLGAKAGELREAMKKKDGHDEALELLREAHQLVDEIVTRAFFNLRRDEDPYLEEEVASPDEARTRAYYMAILPILRSVLAFSDPSAGNGMSAGAAHRFMELLNALVSVDPSGMLDMAVAVAVAGKEHGYHLDSLAVREVVQLAETVLVDHRDRLEAGKPLEDMLRLLDIFAEVGWPQALRLVWRLDEVFR